VLFGARQVWPAHGVADGKAFELLIYLACQPPEGAAREDVAEALWPEADVREDEAHRIRNLRYRLRKVLQSVPGGPQEDGIVPERLLLRLDPSRVQSDAHEFLTLVRAARAQPGPAAVPLLEHARALYAGDLLAGPDARRYAWVDERDTSGVTLREHFRRQFQVATRALADAQLQLDKLPAAVQLYRELVEMDPTDDDCWQALFRLHAQRGDRAALVREEQRMHELLQTLSGDDGPSLDPSDETRLVYQRALDALEAARRVAVEA
jgi:DNA-binding SARP family transcriptional activator